MFTPVFDDLQHVALGLQSSRNSFSPAPQTTPIDGSPVGAQFGDIYGPDLLRWNECGRQHGQLQLSGYSPFITSHPPNLLTSRLAHLPEQVTMTSSLPFTLHGVITPPTNNPSGGYFYPDNEDCAVCTSVVDVYLLTDHSSGVDSLTSVAKYM